MPVTNAQIIKKLKEVAALLEIKGESEFRTQAYYKAARSLSGIGRNLAGMVSAGEDLSKLPGVGSSMAAKIEEIVMTGELGQLKKLNEKYPSSLMDIMHLGQLGPQRTRLLYEKLNIRSLEDLQTAATDGRLHKIRGFGAKTTEHIVREIREYSKTKGHERFNLDDAGEQIQPLVKRLANVADKLEVGGSFRRYKETVGDIDLVAISSKPQKVIETFTGYHETERVVSAGKTRATIILGSGLQVDIRVVKEQEFGATLLYFTGSRAHTIALRTLAQKNGLKINEYGIFKGDERIASATEKDMYQALGLEYIEPELREDKGELDAAAEGRLPVLLTLNDLKGDLQTHTTASDGKNTLEEMVQGARERGYEYYAVTDHSKKVTIANGLDEQRVIKHLEEIEKLNATLDDFTILKSMEVDILEDGSLDLPDEILKELDVVICSIHYHFNLTKREQTKRVLKAMDNPYFNIMGHPTGRILGKRKGYDLDMEEVIRTAKNNGCFLEINASPKRLDLRESHIDLAKEAGLKMSVSTDAHSVSELDFMKYGVGQARRGWLTPDDIINTRSLADLKKLLKR